MKKVEREELLDYVTYSEGRDVERQRVMAIKAVRRIHLGEYLTFLFENPDTIRYQIHEMMRVEQLVKEADILHELQTYNEVLGGEDELGCTLLIEIDSEEERAEKLAKWLDLPKALYLMLESGEKVHAIFDARQVGETRVSSVQYLRFHTPSAPVAIGCDHADYRVEAPLTKAQREALASDLS